MAKIDPEKIETDVSLLQPEMRLAVAQLAKLHDFRVVESWRSRERQEHLVALGKSKTHHSQHMFGKAVDIYPRPDGYVTPKEVVAKIHADWKAIAASLGYPDTRLLAWDVFHLSLNDGVHI